MYNIYSIFVNITWDAGNYYKQKCLLFKKFGVT